VEGLATRRTFFGAMTSTLIRLALAGEGPAASHQWLNQSVFVASLQRVADGPASVMAHVFRLA
jgi:hypothetical protein